MFLSLINTFILSCSFQLLRTKFCNLNIYRQDSSECAFQSENVSQALDFFGTLGEPGDSVGGTSKAEKSKGPSTDLLDSGNFKNKNRKSESSEFRGKRKKRKRATTKGETIKVMSIFRLYLGVRTCETHQ